MHRDPIIEVPCVAANTITAHLMGIPNEPITFADGKRRSEDAIIAYTVCKHAGLRVRTPLQHNKPSNTTKHKRGHPAGGFRGVIF